MTLPLLASALVSVLLGAGDSVRVASAARADSLRPGSSARTANATPAVTADSVVIEKAARRLTLYHRGEPVRMYAVALGRNPVGDKVQRGDNRTPEGVFSIEARNPFSKFYKALRISYPDARHAQLAAKMGVSAGGDIMIHGLAKNIAKLGAGHRFKDWTEGCVAVTNDEIDEIFRAVPVGTPVEIKP